MKPSDTNGTAVALRAPTREQKRQIIEMLGIAYDSEAGRYRGADTDKTVAEAIGGGVLPGWVAQLREEFFGADGGNGEIEAVRAEIVALRKETDSRIVALIRDRDARIAGVTKDLDAKIGDIMAHHKERVEALTRRIDAIKSAVGPKAVRA